MSDDIPTAGGVDLCPYCGCCLWVECAARPCPERVQVLAEIQAAPVLHIGGSA